MYKIKNFSLHISHLSNFTEINSKLLKGLDTFIDDESTRKSHEFFGRFENIYIESSKIPELNDVLCAVKEIAANILKISASELKAGLWFNVMGPGDKTTLHQHDDDDELLSAVYYIKVPNNSGNLILGKAPAFTTVTPEEGMFAFFPPNMPHEVTENLSSKSRISLGINIGPLHSED